MEDVAHDIRFLIIDSELLLMEAEAIRGIAVHIFASFHPFDDGEPLILRDRLGFFLRNCRERVEEHLVAQGEGEDTLFSNWTPIPRSLSFRTYSNASFTFRANLDTDLVMIRSICLCSHISIMRWNSTRFSAFMPPGPFVCEDIDQFPRIIAFDQLSVGF